MDSVLVAYYSFSGNTRHLACDIVRQTGGEVRELIPQKPYAFEHNTASKETRNEVLRGYCPVLLSGNEPIEDFATVFIGTPNWFKSLAPPVLSFLRKHDFSGKTVIPFCTHGGGGFGEIEAQIRAECPKATVLPGLAANGAATAAQVADWLKQIGIFQD